MLARFSIAVIAILLAADQAIGQAVRTGTSGTTAPAWRRAGETAAPTPARSPNGAG